MSAPELPTVMQYWRLSFAYGPEGQREKDAKKRFMVKENIRVFKTSDGRPVSIYSEIAVPSLNIGLGERHEQLKDLKALLLKQKTTFSNILSEIPEFKFPYPSTYDKVKVNPNEHTLEISAKFRITSKRMSETVDLSISTDVTPKSYRGSSSEKEMAYGFIDDFEDNRRLHVWVFYQGQEDLPELP